MNQSTTNQADFNTSSVTTIVAVVRLPGLMDQDSRELALLILGPILCAGVAVFGLTANTVNLVVFFKQGFKENITLSFAVLACFDSASLLALLWLGVAGNPLVRYHPDAPFHAMEIIQLTASLPRSYFSRLSSLVTVYISIERCVSVIKPLEVKNLFTRRRFLVVMVCTVLIYTLNLVPSYYGSRMTWKTDPFTNRTYLGVYYIPDRYIFNSIPQSVDAFSSITIFITIGVCAVILIRKLQKRKDWIERDAETNKGKFLSAKDKKAAFTVTLLAVMFIVCYFITTVCRIVMSSFEEFNRGGRYVNIYLVMWTLGYLMEAVCASGNIFIYVFTSSKYREAFRTLYHCCDCRVKR